ncbi:MAG: transposase [Pseudopelagicola sp.]|nr:transposase [Pseudopelagicola sp.]
MSSYRRPNIPGARVFFTVALARRGASLLVDEIEVLREAVRVTRARRPFGIDAWVVMPDHMHCVWSLPEGGANYSERWGTIKARFSRDVRRKVSRAGFSPPTDLPVVQSGRYAGLKPGLREDKREAGIWQRRFWEHHIRDEADYTAHVRYCWINPVKHGFVARAVEWSYSSIHRYIRAGMVEAEWSGAVPEGMFGE